MVAILKIHSLSQLLFLFFVSRITLARHVQTPNMTRVIFYFKMMLLDLGKRLWLGVDEECLFLKTDVSLVVIA